jgi:hypothetical protein
MSKSIVTRLYVGAIIALGAGLVVVLAAVWAAFAGGVVVVGGDDVVAFNGGSAAWTALALVIVGSLAMMGGAIAALVSWIGALLNTAQLDDKTWFVLLLVLGLLSFGFVAMIAYVIAGPDGSQRAETAPGIATVPSS